MRIGWVQQYWASAGRLTKLIDKTSWDQTWQAASRRERSVLAGTIFAGIVVGWVVAVGLRTIFPAAGWFAYYALCGGVYAWLGRKRPVADAQIAAMAESLGLEIPWYRNWTRDVFRTLPANRAADGRLARWLDGPAGVAGLTALILAFAAISLRQRPDSAAPPLALQVLFTIPVAFGLAAGHRVYFHRRAERRIFAEGVTREVIDRSAGSGTSGQVGPSTSGATMARSDSGDSRRTRIVEAVVIALAVGLFWYLLAPLNH